MKKKSDILTVLNLFAMPVLLVVLGLILLFNPDSAAALLSKILGWVLLLCGTFSAIAVSAGSGGLRMGKLVGAALLLILGVFLIKNPLTLASWIGRIIGILLVIRFLGDTLGGKRSGFPLLSLIGAAAGVVLILVPMTASRLVFHICGIVILCTGIATFVSRLKGKNRQDRGDPNIIDADV